MSEEQTSADQEPAPLGVPDPEPITTNAGDDAIMGTVADQPPEDPDNPPMDEGLTPEEPAPEE